MMKILLLFLAITLSFCAFKSAPYPAWAHSHWVWINGGTQNQTALINMVKQYQKRNITVGAVNIDSAWSTGFNNFEWDYKKFPDPAAFISDMHRQNIRVLAWATAMINNDSNIYQHAKSKGYLLNDGEAVKWWHGYGAFLDYFNPQAKAWWHSLLDPVLDIGLDGWKCDGVDPLLILLKPWPYSKKKSNFVTYRSYANEYYGDFFNYTHKKNPQYGLIMSRPVDSQLFLFISYSPKYVMFSGWVGDQDSSVEGFKDAMTNIFHSAWKGYLNFGFDIGGYRGGNLTKQQFIRYVQIGSMLPLMQNGGGGTHFPWKFDQHTADLYRIYVNLHNQLLPYFLTAGTQAYSKGVSVIQPLAHEQYAISFLYPNSFQYLLWNDFLVSPIFNDEGNVTITFPKSDWVYFFNTSIIYKANSVVDLNIPLEQSAIFARKGSLIPLTNKFLFFYPQDSRVERTIYNGQFNDQVNVEFSSGTLIFDLTRYYKSQQSLMVNNNLIELEIIGAQRHALVLGENIESIKYENNSMKVMMAVNNRITIKGLQIKNN